MRTSSFPGILAEADRIFLKRAVVQLSVFRLQIRRQNFFMGDSQYGCNIALFVSRAAWSLDAAKLGDHCTPQREAVS